MNAARPSWPAALLAVVVLSSGCTTATGDARPGEEPALRFGVLSSSCALHRAAAVRAAGVEVAVITAHWSRFEPVPGHYDTRYAAELARKVATCRGTGLQVVLSPGLHYAPPWVAGLPGGRFQDQYGNQAVDSAPNLVFSGAVRQAAENYLRGLARSVPFDDLAAIRVGNSPTGQLGYPGPPRPPVRGQSNHYWGFDSAAQTGAGLPAGARRTPLPGWVPGAQTWNGRPVTGADVRAWFDWYSGALVDSVRWQAELFWSLGHDGDIHVPLAGRGVLPADLTAAVRTRLDGTTGADGNVQRGLYYPGQLPAIASAVPAGRSRTIVPDVTGLDDSDTVMARRRSPPQDTCRPGDADRDLATAVDARHWSPFRWTVALARQAGLDVVGENPGSPDNAHTGATPDSDPLAEQLVHAPRYAADCGLSMMLWAFEDDLFSDTSGVSLEHYAEQISRYR